MLYPPVAHRARQTMNPLPQATARSIYRMAIDPTARDTEGDDWWQKVHAEVEAVLDAPSTASAAAVIAWWHHDWSVVGDTPTRAARRMRSAGTRLLAKR